MLAVPGYEVLLKGSLVLAQTPWEGLMWPQVGLLSIIKAPLHEPEEEGGAFQQQNTTGMEQKVPEKEKQEQGKIFHPSEFVSKSDFFSLVLLKPLC